MSGRRVFAIVGKTLLWIITLFMAFVFTMQGWSKFPNHGGWARAFAHWHFPVWFRYLIGVLELAAAPLLLWPRTAFLGAVTIIVIMLGGMATHVWWHHPREVFHEVGPLVVASVIALARWRVSIVPVGRR
jgi:uncharacterized membrane protein YphA (DoxX/SURF4 family)